MFANRVSTSEPQMALRPNPSRPRFFFGRPDSSVVSESSQATAAPLISPSRSKYYSFGKGSRTGSIKGVGSDVASQTSPRKEEVVKKSNTVHSKASSSRSINNHRAGTTKHHRNNSELIKRDIIGTWNEDVVQCTVSTESEVEKANTSATPAKKNFVQTPDRFSPLPANISKAAAKRLGITIEIPKTASPPPQDSPIDWALSTPVRYDDRGQAFVPVLAKSTFYSSESEIEDLEASLCDTGSSRTSYNVSTPLDANRSVSPVGGKLPFPLPNLGDEMMRLPILPVPQRKSSKRVLRTTQMQHSPQNSTSSTDSAQSLQRSKSFSKPLPHRPNSFDVDRPQGAHTNDELRMTLNDRAVNIRNKMAEINTLPEVDSTIPAVPPRSRRRDWIKRVSSKGNMTNHPTRQDSTKQAFTPLPTIQGHWVEPETITNLPTDGTHPAFRTQSPLSKPDEETPITADAAEFVIARMLENLDDLKDLFAAARTNRGFYSVFKRHELRLMKQTVKNMSLAAWEMREASVKEIISSAEDSRVDYTPTRYLQFYRRDAYILAALKSLILVRCQSCMRPETIDSLRDRTGSKRVDDALWRIWTFCTVFGSGKGREDDIIGQMDWLRGGPFAHFATGVESAAATGGRKASIASESFGRGNAGGLKTEQLRDMLEMWKCVKFLLHGITGPGRVAQARKYGVFDGLDNNTNTVNMSDDKFLDEWVAYLTTLGLSTILDLATPSTSKTTRVFLTAHDMRWTAWKPLANGASRSTFLQDAVTRVYNEEVASTRRAASASVAAVVTRPSRPAPSAPAGTPTTQPSTKEPHEDAAHFMNLWLQYQARHAPMLPLHNPSNPTTTSSHHHHQHHTLRPATSLSLFPPPLPTSHRSMSPAPPAFPRVKREAAGEVVEAGPSVSAPVLGRFGGLRGKKSAPELRRWG